MFSSSKGKSLEEEVNSTPFQELIKDPKSSNKILPMPTLSEEELR